MIKLNENKSDYYDFGNKQEYEDFFRESEVIQDPYISDGNKEHLELTGIYSLAGKKYRIVWEFLLGEDDYHPDTELDDFNYDLDEVVGFYMEDE